MNTYAKSMLITGFLPVLLTGSLGLVSSALAGNVVGTGQVHTVTEKNQTLIGNFSGVIIGIDRADINMEGASIDCGGVPGSLGVSLGTHSGVHITGGTIQHCTVGVMLGQPFQIGPTAGSNNLINKVAIKDLVPSGPTYFNGDGIASNNGNNNRFVNNDFSNLCNGIRVFQGRDNDVVGNKVQGACNLMDTDGIILQDTFGANVHGNLVTAQGGTYGIRALNSNSCFISGNSASGASTADLFDYLANCADNVWRGNTFVTDGGAETDGPGAGCIR